jgi:5'-nucleotidase
MKRFLLLILTLICSASAYPQNQITIIHTNDLHSRLTGYSPESLYTPLSVNDDKTVGGFARITSVINHEKQKAGDKVLVLDAGDFLMGTLFQGIEPTEGFQLRLMKRMGYDVVSIGNHEFDFGPAKLAEIIRASERKGEIPQLVLSNAVTDDKDPSDDELEKLFSEGIIARSTVIERAGLSIGIFALMGKVADENAAFAPPVRFASQIKTAGKMVEELKSAGCDLIICLSHSGLAMDKNGEWAGEDVELARKVKGLNVIISGHTHTKIDKPLIINGVSIVQTGEYGKNAGILRLNKSEGTFNVEGYDLVPVDDRIHGDEAVHGLIEEMKGIVTSKILAGLGVGYDSKIAESSFMLECDEAGAVSESNLGPLVADAIQAYVNKHSDDGTDLSMVAAGVIRDRLMPGLQAAPDIFRIMSMGSGNDNVPGYPLSRIYVSGRELKSILEILLVSGASTPSNYCYFSGIKVDYDPGKGLLKKISSIKIAGDDGNFREIDFSRRAAGLYSVTANSYMLQFIGIIKKMSFGLINVVPKDKSGTHITDMSTAVIDMNAGLAGIQEGREWLALMEFLSVMRDVDNNGIPDLDQKYRQPVRTFFTTY